jgi:hypothetical protein
MDRRRQSNLWAEPHSWIAAGNQIFGLSHIHGSAKPIQSLLSHIYGSPQAIQSLVSSMQKTRFLQLRIGGYGEQLSSYGCYRSLKKD